ncbi:MAG: hypothetical protein LBI06_00185 [Treponema sp.]|jgi:hypothetical protein|nr:hypothetical protein [Treponema sp.]
MNRSLPYRIFHSGTSPLAYFTGAALLVMASDRLAHAITVLGALVWVYCFSSLVAHVGAKIFPRHGRIMLFAFLGSFFAGIYLLLLWMLSPLCALETFFVIALIPMFCMTSGVFNRMETLDLSDTLLAAFTEAAILGALIVILALIREPLGYLSLSLPGGAKGIVLLFSFETESFLPIRLIASSCGALLLLGYAFQLYRYFKEKYVPQSGPQEDKDDL